MTTTAQPAPGGTPAGKTILWIDPNLTFGSPTTKHLLYALPHLRQAGWTVRAWCVHSDAPHDEVEHVFFTIPRALATAGSIVFFLKVNLHGLWLRMRGGKPPAAIIHASSGTYLGAGLVSVQFLCGLWARRWLSLGVSGWKEWARYAINLWGVLAESLQWRSPALRLLLPASDSIGHDLRRHAPERVQIRTLPNSYDETRFNLEVRARWREPRRASLGYGPDDRVFAFVSMGHYKRKGFWLAVEALDRLRRDAAAAGGPGRAARLLVVGGKPGTLEELAAQLDRRHDGWRQWITFAGMQTEVERFFAAADAFLFPSYFEAFCLAEIEAAASGLPLLLTPHHGSEMILRDGVNGVRLSFEPEEMSRQIGRFLESGLNGFVPGGTGQGLNREQYGIELLKIYDSVLAAGR